MSVIRPDTTQPDTISQAVIVLWARRLGALHPDEAVQRLASRLLRVTMEWERRRRSGRDCTGFDEEQERLVLALRAAGELPPATE